MALRVTTTAVDKQDIREILLLVAFDKYEEAIIWLYYDVARCFNSICCINY